jgi:hypothetical protein
MAQVLEYVASRQSFAVLIHRFSQLESRKETVFVASIIVGDAER